MHTFYNGLSASARIIIDALAGGALIRATVGVPKSIKFIILIPPTTVA